MYICVGLLVGSSSLSVTILNFGWLCCTGVAAFTELLLRPRNFKVKSFGVSHRIYGYTFEVLNLALKL